MNNEGKNILKFCSFYVSEWHLITMMMPYISKKVEKDVKVFPILENNIEKNIETLVERMNLKDNSKILNINWTNKNDNIEDIINNNMGNEIIIIINGSKKFIKTQNNEINAYIEENHEILNKTNTRLKIIDCYEIVEFNGSIVEILDQHDKILNTSGEKEINEIFPDYIKKEKIS